MHPALSPLRFLVGTWKSTSAKGHFPNIKDFSYEETIQFEEIGQPLLNFKSTSRIGDRPMHLESGFLKIVPGSNKLSFLVSHNFGICSIEEGEINETKIVLESKDIIRTSSAKEPHVTKLRRTIQLVDGKLEISTEMATTRVPELTNHLVVLYEKSSEWKSLLMLLIIVLWRSRRDQRVEALLIVHRCWRVQSILQVSDVVDGNPKNVNKNPSLSKLSWRVWIRTTHLKHSILEYFFPDGFAIGSLARSISKALFMSFIRFRSLSQAVFLKAHSTSSAFRFHSSIFLGTESGEDFDELLWLWLRVL